MTSSRDRWIAVYIALLSALLAVCALGGEDITKDRLVKATEAASTWAWFQAKHVRRDALQLAVEDLEMRLATEELSATQRQAIEERVANYKQEIAELTSEPETGEGMEELFTRGKALEAERALAEALDPVFDQSQALLQIAIVLASVAIAAGGALPVALSLGCAGLGAILMVEAYAIAKPETFGVVMALVAPL